MRVPWKRASVKTTQKRPHPPLRGTFSRRREKGGFQALRVLAFCSSPSPVDGRGVGVRVLWKRASITATQKRPHPPPWGTFSRRREKGGSRTLRALAFRSSPSPVDGRGVGVRVLWKHASITATQKCPHPPPWGTFSRRREKGGSQALRVGLLTSPARQQCAGAASAGPWQMRRCRWPASRWPSGRQPGRRRTSLHRWPPR